MAAAGTLLADLDNSQGSDGDLVQKILSDMNIPTNSRPPSSAPPPLPAQTPIYQQQMASPMTMDSRIPVAHMIGNEHPSPADFASAMSGQMQMPQGQGQQQGQGQGQGQWMQQQGQQWQGQGQGQQGQHYDTPSKNIYSRIVEELKVPFLVALLFFVFSLPPIRILVAHYLPQLIKTTGEFTTPGLLVVSGLAGATFWVLQRVIAPLLSL